VTSPRRHRLGAKLREVRRRKGFTMKRVASTAGVSESLLSQIERDRVSPSIDTLIAVAEVLDVDLEYLFSDLKRNKPVEISRSGERTVIREAGVAYHKLCGIGDAGAEHAIEAVLLEVEPGCRSGHTEYGHPGRELGYLLSGEARLEYGTESYLLGAGDSVSFSSDIPHTLTNTGTQMLTAVWVNTPPRVVFPGPSNRR
jgi:transcriptional regulator with XRE-family HTH domain